MQMAFRCPLISESSAAAHCRGAFQASALYRNASNKRNICRGAFRAPANKRQPITRGIIPRAYQMRTSTRGGSLQQAAYSIAIQIKDLVRCLSVRPTLTIQFAATHCRGALRASALYRNASNKRNICRGAFRAPVNLQTGWENAL